MASQEIFISSSKKSIENQWIVKNYIENAINNYKNSYTFKIISIFAALNL